MSEKILLITGATSDVGCQLFEAVHGDYDHIFLQYRTMNEDLSKLIEEYNSQVDIRPIQCDFSDITNVFRMIDDIKTTGLIPNNIVHLPAPKAYNMHFHKDEWENYSLGWEISVHSIVEVLKAFIPYMVKENYGRIVFMLTSCTVYQPAKFQSSYVTVKYALLGLMKSLSVEYISKGITVNGVSPDMMETKFLSELPRLLVETNAYNSPLGRNIYVEEVIPVIQLLLADSSASMTGQNIAVMGGGST